MGYSLRTSIILILAGSTGWSVKRCAQIARYWTISTKRRDR